MPNAETQGHLNPLSIRYFTSFTISLSFSHFPYTVFPIQSGLEAIPACIGGGEGKAASPSHKQTNTLMFTFMPMGYSCYLHLFGQWKESGASSRNQGNSGRKCKHHHQVTVSLLKISFYMIHFFSIYVL